MIVSKGSISYPHHDRLITETSKFFKGKDKGQPTTLHRSRPSKGRMEPGTYFRVEGKVVAPPYPKGSVPDGSLFISAHGLPTRRNTLVEGADGYSIWQWAQSKPHSATNVWKLYYPRPTTTPSITSRFKGSNNENQQLRGMLGEMMD